MLYYRKKKVVLGKAIQRRKAINYFVGQGKFIRKSDI